MLSTSVNGWTDIGVGHWTDIDLILLTLAALSFGLRLKGSALFHTHTHNTFNDRSFSAAGPRAWNTWLLYL